MAIFYRGLQTANGLTFSLELAFDRFSGGRDRVGQDSSMQMGEQIQHFGTAGGGRVCAADRQNAAVRLLCEYPGRSRLFSTVGIRASCCRIVDPLKIMMSQKNFSFHLSYMC